MLTLTDDARQIVRVVAEQTSGGRATGGLRISSGEHHGTDFAIELAGGPEAGDVVVEEEGARVFLTAQAAEALADKMLDAGFDRKGVVSFDISDAPREGEESDRPEGMTAVRSTGATSHDGHTHH